MEPQAIYISRHASPDWERIDLVYHLPPGPPLSEQGILEAQALGRFFRAQGVWQLWSSPLERCQHTALIAGEIAGAEVIILPELSEWQPGETEEAVRLRVLPAFEKASVESQVNGSVALVTHGGPVAALLVGLGLSAWSLERYRVYDHRNPLPPGGAWKASRPDTGKPWELALVFKPDLD